MEVLNYNPIGFESEDMAIDVTQFQIDEASFHGDCSKIFADEMNNSETPLSDLTSSWLNQFTSVVKGFESVDDEIVTAASEGLPDKTDSENLANGLGSLYTNWPDDSLNKFLLNHTDLIDSKGTETNNGQLIGDDFAFSKSLDLMGEGKINPENRKTTTVTLTNTENIDGFVGAFQEIDQNILKMCPERPVESTRHFETTKSKQFDLLSNGGKEDMGCTQTYSKRKRAKISDKVDGDEFDTTNFTSTDSSKRVMQLASVAGRGRNRGAKPRNLRSETRFQSTFDDSSPVSSPEAEVPSQSSVNTNEYVADEQLINLETKELNRRVKFLPKPVVQEIKHRRRTLKNRGYARSCREKKMSETSTLQRSNGDLEKELASKRVELQLMMLQRNDWKHKYEELSSACKKHGIQVEQ